MKITAIKQQVRRGDRYSIYVEGVYSFSLSESALLSEGLASGQEVDAARLAALKEASGIDKAYGSALRYLAIRPRSEWEVKTYLGRKGIDEAATIAILGKLKTLGLIDDFAFGKSWLASRRLLKNTSKRRLRLELKQKQLNAAVIDSVLASDETSDLDTLRQLVQKKQARYPDKTKFMQYLARQGFGYDEIKTVLGEALDT